MKYSMDFIVLEEAGKRLVEQKLVIVNGNNDKEQGG